ncbi:MAG: hypothetical protein K2X49_25785 [Acetobacteraceae bacterium]|nr:hypothetical protein [Acetobacteraceae bacterium]
MADTAQDPPRAAFPGPATEARKARKPAEEPTEEQSSVADGVFGLAADCRDVAGTCAEVVGSVVGSVAGAIFDA